MRKWDLGKSTRIKRAGTGGFLRTYVLAVVSEIPYNFALHAI